MPQSLFIGILNLTPDSFSDGGHFVHPEAALAQAKALVEAGAGMLDLGAESTRPGALPLHPAQEWERLSEVIPVLRKAFPDIPLSLDTRHPETAQKGLEAGISILNDVTGFSDPTLLALAKSTSAPLIAMRSRIVDGKIWMPDYSDPEPKSADDILSELRDLRDRILDADISPERLILDPGFGFGTSFQEDLALWNSLPELPRLLDWPVEQFCIGVSRKRFVAWKMGQPSLPPRERDEGTAHLHQQAQSWGYRIFRTHALGRLSMRSKMD